jgi:Mg/Co/Ni transporter MgtE
MQADDLVGSYDQDDAVDQLADIIESDFNEFMPEVSGFFADMLNGAMRKVNWREIASKYVDESISVLEADSTEETE